MYMSKACKFVSIFLGNQGSPKTPPSYTLSFFEQLYTPPPFIIIILKYERRGLRGTIGSPKKLKYISVKHLYAL